MAYQVLARKWRPQDFSSLVGQSPIVTALSNALRESRIAQAYLFSGIRGVGKTSTARLLAKALNCEQGPTGTPCNQCLPCREITRGSDLDVIEVDAATYSKVEQVRDLTESLRYGPARDRFKVLIIDEVHRLSRQAFDALLKIVEEPPPHVVFIFATTESEAVPATILSRCQEFRFRRVTAQDLTAHLKEIATAESITASDTALRLIARAGEGSVRDSVALLDQLATFGAGTIRDEDAAHLAGGLDAALFLGLLEAILGGDAAAVSAVAARVEAEGWDPRHVYPQFLAFCRDALHLAAGGAPERVDLPADDAAALARIARAAGYENLLRLLQLLLACEEAVRRSEASAVALEIAWLRAAELPKLMRIEELLAGGDTSVARAAPPAPRLAPATRPPRVAAPREPAPSSPPPAEDPAVLSPVSTARLEGIIPRAAADPSPPGEPDAEATLGTSATTAAAQREPADAIAAFREEVSARRQPLAAQLEAAQELAFEDGELLVYLPAGREGEMLQRALERAGNRQAMDEAAARVWGAGVRWRAIAGQRRGAGSATGGNTNPPANGPREAGAAPAKGGPGEPQQHPTVQAVLEIFGGSVQTIAPRDEGQEE